VDTFHYCGDTGINIEVRRQDPIEGSRGICDQLVPAALKFMGRGDRRREEEEAKKE